LARPTAGGRANTFRDPVTGERVDNGQHALAGCYSETLAFLARVGARQKLHWPATLRVPMIDEQNRRTELVLPPLPSPLHLAAAVCAWDVLTREDRWAIVRVGRALTDRAGLSAGETVRQWLERHGQTPRLCRLLWEPLALAALNQPIDTASAAAFVAVTSRMFSSAPDAATLLLPAVPLDELYVTPAREFLARCGGRITTHAKGTVVFEGSRVAAVVAGGDRIAARHVICAVPWFALADVLMNAPPTLERTIAAASAMTSSPIVTVNLWLDEGEFLDAFLGLPGRTFQWVFGRHVLMGRADSHLSLVSSGADAIAAATNEQAIALAVRELREALPALGRVRHAHVIRERRATFSLRPGEPPRPATTTDVPGLLLAGDWIETGLPATIESAVVSGHRAARTLLGQSRH
jgi:hydroxysqualene dehydroxylase